MAKKEPETVDRYQIVAETSIEQMGYVLAALAKMGVENVGYKLITDVHRFKSRERTVHDVSAEDFTAAYVKDNARFTPAQLVAHFKDAGRTASSAYYALKKLMQANVVRKNGDEYVRVEALAPPEAKRTGRGTTPPYAVANKDLIATAIRGRKQFTVRELREVFAKEGRPEKSISPILTQMIQRKEIKLVGKGHYVVLAKGAKPAASDKTKRLEKDKQRKRNERAAKKNAAVAEAPAAHIAAMNGSGEAAHG
ncbi:hypothetical protein I6F35_06205 [Bradyrhizobium sp. BRP22]|uniref:hypothetical protein n=1 Tax=Bradyrhizobium sp. BRP22 TaxID=2793821 RepID=UPI001CD40AAC|nr:hypothetical protein [Bradyrhizobium sp. BRP22]MCA1452812.1 hypothetical protein [Bradyrhizobium sp. BRP22]